jgi:hypothetical protein
VLDLFRELLSDEKSVDTLSEVIGTLGNFFCAEDE